MTSVDFYFDLSCPYSFMVSTQINEICSKYNITPTWHPFLKSDQAPKPYTSAPNKLKYNNKLLLFYAQRTVENNKFYQRLYQTPSTTNAMAFLASQNDNQTLIKSAKKLFNSIWIGNLQDNNSILNISKQFMVYNSSYNKLIEITRNAAKQFNVFTTPTIIINKTDLFIGMDRLANVEQALNTKSMCIPISRIKYNILPNIKTNTLEFYFDFSSPWAYIGYCRLYELKGFVNNIIYKPILLGALFRDIGTPNAPALAMSNKQREYGSIDLERWKKIAGVNLQFNTNFPIRTVLPLRVFIINNKTIDCIYRGAWQWNVNIGNENHLCKLLNDYGFNGNELIKKAKSDKIIKRILRNNTEFAKEKGMFGVPSYVINGDYHRFIWGQEKLDFVKDLCCGWKPIVNIKTIAKL
eukprot:161652_1